ncbi:TPA: pilus assembly protein, partial [Vibrio cholerae]
PDLMQVAMQRLQSIDLGALKKKAIERFWSRQTFTELPKATQYRIRMVDPTIVMQRPLLDANGRTLIPAGTRINPLKALPFTQQLVVFNALNAEEVDAVAHWLETQDRTLRRITLITTQLDRAQGWNRLNALEKTLDSPVYLLNASLKQRFDLQVTPSFVQAKGLAFEIEEIPAKELVHEKAQ